MNQAQPDTWGAIREEMERLRAERDAAIHERDTYARGMDALAAQLAVASDKRVTRLAERALKLLAEGARLQSRDGGGPLERDYTLRRAELLAEAGVVSEDVEGIGRRMRNGRRRVRTSRHTIKCAKCPARITLELEDAAWHEPARDWVAAMGHKLGRETQGEVRCALHRGQS